MIDAQLTTEVFGLFAPSRPDIALRMAHLPVRVSALASAAHIAEFYIVMHALAAIAPRPEMSLKDKTRWLATQARTTLPDGGTAAACSILSGCNAMPPPTVTIGNKCAI